MHHPMLDLKMASEPTVEELARRRECRSRRLIEHCRRDRARAWRVMMRTNDPALHERLRSVAADVGRLADEEEVRLNSGAVGARDAGERAT